MIKKLSSLVLSGSLLLLNNLNFVFAETEEKVLTTSEINKIVENKDNIYGSPNKYWNEETGEFIIPDGYTRIEKNIVAYSKEASTKCLISGKVKKIVLPNTMKRIDDEALSGLFTIEKINLPESLEYIGRGNFSETKIKELKWPSSVTTIEEGMFSYGDIEKIEIPNTVTHIKNSAFFGTQLKEIYIPDSVVEIEHDTFYDCNKLAKVRLSNNIKKINNNMFWRNDFETIDIPESVVEIGSDAFAGSKLKNLKLSKNLKKIDRAAFWFCEDLESLEMPGVTVLGDYVFSNCEKLNRLVVSSEFFKSKDISPKAFSGEEEEFYDLSSEPVKENSVDVFVTDGISGLNIFEIKAQNKWIRSIQSLNQETESSSNSGYLPNTGLANTKNLAVFVLALSLGIFCVLNKKQKI